MSAQQFLVRKASGETEPFDLEKLEHSLRRANASKQAIKHVTHHILQELEDGISTHEIYEHAFSLLHKFEHRSALKYSLRRAVLELGPSGFPFERLVAELFKQRGYETLTDQIVKGYCAEHEIDVVAWKKHIQNEEPKLVMSEVKFHSQPGLKSDLKIVLYVKARYEDLSKMIFSYGGEELHLGEGSLVTNTKFTVSAIKYAECQKLKVIGWNYPLDGSLHDLIDAARLHPLTCLHTLSEHDKKTLLDQGYIICKTLMEKPEILANIGLTAANREMVLEEIHSINESPGPQPETED